MKSHSPDEQAMQEHLVTVEEEDIVSDFELDIDNDDYKTICLASDNRRFFDLRNFKLMELEEEKKQAIIRENLIKSHVNMMSKNISSLGVSQEIADFERELHLLRRKTTLFSIKNPISKRYSNLLLGRMSKRFQNLKNFSSLNDSGNIGRIETWIKAKKYNVSLESEIQKPNRKVKRSKSLSKTTTNHSRERSYTCDNKISTYEFYRERYCFLTESVLYRFPFFVASGIQEIIIEDKVNCEKLMSEMEEVEEAKRRFFEETKIKSCRIFNKLWKDLIPKIKAKSPFANFPSYFLKPMIVKGSDDLRQEIMAIQLMKKFQKIFQHEHTGLYLRPYEIIATSANSGFLEFLTDTITLSDLKKKFEFSKSLDQMYFEVFTDHFEHAQKSFIESLAGYSLFCYLLQVKDRHNGNILIDNEGHLIHIDFGFIISNSPGNISFETAPFKLTQVG